MLKMLSIGLAACSRDLGRLGQGNPTVSRGTPKPALDIDMCNKLIRVRRGDEQWRF